MIKCNLKRCLTFSLFLLIGVLSLYAQKDKTDNTLPVEKPKKQKPENVTPTKFEDTQQTDRLAEWLKSPYLNTPLEKATVGEITFAFEKWKKVHPEKMKTLHKDDAIIKFSRQLHRMQMDNGFGKYASAHEKLDAFEIYAKEHPQTPVSNFNNPDANWRLLGPITQPLFQEIYEVTEPTNKSTDLSGLGRINCIEFSIWDTKNIWVGTSTGGVWKTWDGGKTWICITLNLPIAEISDIAIDQSNSNIVYVATGDRDGQGGWYGNGIGSRLYKTTDGGNTWHQITANFGTGTYIEGLWVHPKRPWEVVVAKTNGMYKSSDGGATWVQTLNSRLAPPFAAPNNLRFYDAKYADLANTERIYSLYMRITDPETFTGVYEMRRSDDFGQTWQTLDSITAVINDPRFLTNEIKMGISPSDANCLYIAATEFDTVTSADRFGALMRTLDGGKTWETKSRYPSVPNIMGWIMGDSSDVGSQSFYDFVVAIDPKNKDKVYVSGVDMWGSIDGGKSFNKTTLWINSLGESAHADHHWGEFQPISGDYYVGTDGGLYKTSNLAPGNNAAIENCYNGLYDLPTLVTNIFTPGCYTFPTKWEFVGHGIATADVYAIAVSKSNPSIVMAGLQDNSTIQRREGKWYGVGGPWDGFVPLIHPTDPNTFYTSVQFGQIFRTYDGGKSYKEIGKMMDTVDMGNWFTPLEILESNPKVIYQARQHNLWKTTDAGDTWNTISDFPNTEVYNETTALGISQSNPNTIYVARFTVEPETFKQNNYLFKTTDGGATWTNIWSADFPNITTNNFNATGTIKDIEVHPSQPNKIWVCFNIGYAAANPNQAKKVFYSEDGGVTWKNITEGLPPVPAWSIAAQENSAVGAVYVGTGFGIYYKDNTMSKFVEFQRGMPRGVPVVDLKIHTGAGKIYAGTYGRGVWSANLHDQPYDGGAVSLQRDRSLLLNVYPNPAKEFIKIEWDDAIQEGQTLSILDLHGRAIHTQDRFQNRMTFDMSAYPAGIYSVLLRSNKEVITRKFILTK